MSIGRQGWSRRAGSIIGALCLAVALGAAPGPDDPLKDAKNPQLATSDRVRAAERVWASDKPRETRREDLKSILWIQRNGASVRQKCLELLYADAGDADHADTRQMMRLMLATEADFAVLDSMCRIIEKERWPDLAGPVIRSWSRFVASRTDDERPERRALAALAGDKPLDEFVYDFFTAPVKGEGREKDRAEKERAASWELLGRLDKDGSRRRAMINAGRVGASSDPLIAALQAAAIELRAVPLTASQLNWARQLRQETPKAKAWWSQATAAIAALPADRLEGLRLRHAEPIRWAAANRPQWLQMDRDALLAEMHKRLRGRTLYPRTGGDDTGPPISERLADWESKMAWGDVLSLMVVDESLRTPGLVQTLWAQAERDIKDVSTELGGVMEPVDSGGFALTLYPPRPTQRSGDRRFVASDDMLANGAFALCHYHFHAQRIDNGDYAGPGPGDVEYAEDQGRLCLVFTTIREGLIDADYYQAGGVRIDLGTLRLPKE